MKCLNCASTELHNDSARGSVYCGECGMVQEENAIVNTLQFDTDSNKPSLHGKIINFENTNIGTNYVDSTYYIKNTIFSICQRLSLGKDYVECSFRWYKLCLQHSLSKGKSIIYTLSACIYLSCRQENTPHLLIDFSSELRIDMYKIGKVFLKLRNLLDVEIPLIDPSLYMHRFVSQLRFENKQILPFSILLVSRMKKDWILEGRRPNNSCGAALLIASRIFNEERSIFEVAKVVHASVSVINKRLLEIQETESADLKIDQFNYIWYEAEANPPVFKTPIVVEEADNKDEEEIEFYKEGFDSEEFVLNDEEYKVKEHVWDSMYGEYLKERKNKKKKPRSSKKYGKKHGFNTVEEAFNSLDKKISSKLNYSALDGLFEP